MALAKTKEARLFYRAAKQRYDDALLLLEGNRKTGAVYLAGYTVECFLKALLLESVSPAVRKALIGEFLARFAHNFERLGPMYLRHLSLAIAPNADLQLPPLARVGNEHRVLLSAPR